MTSVGPSALRGDWDADFVLDREFRFVSTAKMRTLLTVIPALGRSAWDVFGGEQHLRPGMEKVFETGEPCGCRVYYDGTLLEIHAEPAGRHLRVRYRVLREVRVASLNALLEDMQFVAAELSRPFGSRPLTDLAELSERAPARMP